MLLRIQQEAAAEKLKKGHVSHGSASFPWLTPYSAGKGRIGFVLQENFRFFSALFQRMGLPALGMRAQELSGNIIRIYRGPLQDNLSEWGLLSKTVLQEAPLPTPPFILKKGGVQALNVPARLADAPGWDSRAPINGELIYSHTDQSP